MMALISIMRICVTSSGPTRRRRTATSGVDDDGNGYVDDIHGWDFVDNSPDVSPKGECRSRVSHGTLMASTWPRPSETTARNCGNQGPDGARLMILRVVGCNRGVNDDADPKRLTQALDYATGWVHRSLASVHIGTRRPQN